MTFSQEAPVRIPDWESRALGRSLASAQARSTDRIRRIVAAARELADETGSAGFTVAQVAQRAGLSLKSVYRSFAGKDDILLALLEEESTIGADILAAQIGRYDDPVRRMRAYVEGIFEMLTHPGAVGYAGVLVREERRLSEHHPDALRVALAPLVDLLASQIDAAAAAGRAQPGDVGRAAETVFGVLLGGIADVTVGRADPRDLASWLWQFCASGLGVREAHRTPARRRDRDRNRPDERDPHRDRAEGAQ